MTTRILTTAIAAALLGTIGSTAQAQVVGPITFENGTAASNDFTNNFRVTVGQANFGQTDPADTGEPNNDYVFQAKNAAGDALIAIYDTTPGDGADAAQAFTGPITISIDISSAEANSSVGIFIFDPANSVNNVIGLLNIDRAGTAERIRFARDNALSGVTFNNVLSDTEGANADSGLGISPDATPVFGTLSLTYTPGTASDSLVLTLGTFSSAFTLTSAIERVGPTVGVAIRVNDNSNAVGSAKFDNFTVVPEPGAAVSLLGGAGLLMGFARRRAMRSQALG